jgi:hypothetical protein
MLRGMIFQRCKDPPLPEGGTSPARCPEEMDDEPWHSSLATPSKACACDLIFFAAIIIRRLWGVLRTSQRAHHPRETVG